MITNKGKDIIAKYLIGQTPGYASYIALGCGRKPLSSATSLTPYFDEFSAKQNLELEMFRTQITSRGYVTELVYDDNTDTYVEVSKVVFTAELPPEQRYGITEIGVFSAKSNPSAIDKDSRTLFTFTDAENWEYHNETASVGLGDVFYSPLYATTNDGNINITPSTVAFRANTNNALFAGTSNIRKTRHETGRYLNVTTYVPGNMSYLVKDSTTGHITPKISDSRGYYGNHIHLSGTTIDLTKNAPNDELRLAFSIVNKLGASELQPATVRLMVEFSADDTTISTNHARMQTEIVDINVDPVNGVDLSTNRYFVIKTTLADLIKTTTFSWNSVKLVKIYASVFDASNNLTDNYYISLDALRFENIASENPLYGLVGYSAIRTDDALPIMKEANSSNMIEFRFGLDVV